MLLKTTTRKLQVPSIHICRDARELICIMQYDASKLRATKRGAKSSLTIDAYGAC